MKTNDIEKNKKSRVLYMEILNPRIREYIKLATTCKGVDAKNESDLKMVCNHLGVEYENLTRSKQIHSDIVLVADNDNKGNLGEGDAIITNLLNTPLITLTADCVPIAFIDARNKAIGVAHAGWRGTFEEIGIKTIKKMEEEYGTRPKDLVCIIGACIGSCCYEVSEDLVNKFVDKFSDTMKLNNIYESRNGKNYLDLGAINEKCLEKVGVPYEHIYNIGQCTSCEKHNFHSYRAHNGTSKRIGLIVSIAG